MTDKPVTLMKRVLLISYNGVLEPIVQSQVLPYVRGLSRSGYQFILLSFEKWKGPHHQMRRQIAAMQATLQHQGIRWVALRYHKRPSLPATLWDIWCGTWAALWLVWRHRVCLIHARASIAGIMAIVPVRLLRCRLLFDIRGFNAEEYVDGSGWSRHSARYRVLKWLEGYLMRVATQNVVLTEAARRAVQEERYAAGTAGVPVSVIPTCVDTDRFRPDAARASRMAGELPLASLTAIYLGSLGTWYLVDEMVAFLATLRTYQPSLRLLCITQSDAGIMKRAWARQGLAPAALTTLRTSHDEVPAHLSTGHFGLCFIKPSLSKQSSYPTKIGEYLACGLPVVLNASQGDCDRFVEQQGVGVVVERLDPEGYRQVCGRLLKLLEDPRAIAGRCREAAQTYLSLSVGLARYRQVYEQCVGDASPASVSRAPVLAVPITARAIDS